MTESLSHPCGRELWKVCDTIMMTAKFTILSSFSPPAAKERWPALLLRRSLTLKKYHLLSHQVDTLTGDVTIGVLLELGESIICYHEQAVCCSKGSLSPSLYLSLSLSCRSCCDNSRRWTLYPYAINNQRS